MMHALPSTRVVAQEQVRATGHTMRVPAIIFGVLLVMALIAFFAEGDVMPFRPERWAVFGILGLVFPIAVWTGEQRFGASFAWTLPVERSRHALIKVFAGWVWLMAAVAVLMLVLLVLAMLSGGSVFGAETIHQLTPGASVPTFGRIDPRLVQTVEVRAQPLLWLVPFTSATALYLLSSAFVLATRYPARWITGTVFLLFLLGGLASMSSSRELALAPSHAWSTLLEGKHGFWMLTTATTEPMRARAILPSGDAIRIWEALPDPGTWLTTTMIWLAFAGVALFAAAYRHRERRPAS